jgi:signal transduction histidine kinase
VRIEVQDTGIGIALEDQALIFEDFRQVQDDLSRAYQGTGLGLSISRRLVELHGGQMWVESSPGQGSTFCFTMPIVIRALTPLSLFPEEG